MTQPCEPPRREGGGRALFSVDPGEDAACGVCGEPVESGASALCNQCGDPYHLVLTNAGEGKNCGEVWLNEEFLALEFGCGRCLMEARGAPPPEPRGGGGREGESGPVRHAGRSARDIVRGRRR